MRSDSDKEDGGVCVQNTFSVMYLDNEVEEDLYSFTNTFVALLMQFTPFAKLELDNHLDRFVTKDAYRTILIPTDKEVSPNTLLIDHVYSSVDEIIEEFKGKVGNYLPGDFDWL